jgi:hypothetical protein
MEEFFELSCSAVTYSEQGYSEVLFYAPTMWSMLYFFYLE